MSAIQNLRERYLRDETTPLAELESALDRANGNAGRNVYLAQDAAWSHGQALALDRAQMADQPLWGVPISLKDCFDLKGLPYLLRVQLLPGVQGSGHAGFRAGHAVKGPGRCHHGQDPPAPARLRNYRREPRLWRLRPTPQPTLAHRRIVERCGGECAGRLRLAAIGTDTGGSIRVPAALCGLAGYRSSISLQGKLWEGGGHLAPTFDTLGWLYRDLADGPLLGRALLDLPDAAAPELAGLRIGVPADAFLHDCEPDVLATLAQGRAHFIRNRATVETFDASAWDAAFSIFAPNPGA